MAGECADHFLSVGLSVIARQWFPSVFDVIVVVVVIGIETNKRRVLR